MVARKPARSALDLAEPVRKVLLDLPPKGGVHRKAPRESLSAVALHGRSLFVASDEGTVLDRLTMDGKGGFAEPCPFPLLAPLSLPNTSGEDDEIDIEGLVVESDLLWLVGSHSRTRGKPKNDPLAELALVRHNPNRHVLACLKLVGAANEVHEPALESAARLPIGRKRSALVKALKPDPHLKPFFRLPAKENGFDIEGLAARGRRILLGLRGPVLRGIAIVLEIEVEEAKPGELALKPLAPDGRLWRKHLLDLGGNGVRDLHQDGDDVLILAGPTADLDGRCAIWRWREPWALGADSFVADGQHLQRVLRIPVGNDADHPEGIAILPGEKGRELLVVYDAPAKERCRGKGGVLADLFELPAT